MFTLSFDQKSLSEIAQFYGWKTFLTDSVGVAMKQAGDLIVQTAQDNTWSAFQNPTGSLSDSIQSIPDSSWEVQVGVGEPYAARLEFGFHGADSLGRVYDQNAEPYLQPAMDANSQAILQLIDEAVLTAWSQMGGGQ